MRQHPDNQVPRGCGSRRCSRASGPVNQPAEAGGWCALGCEAKRSNVLSEDLTKRICVRHEVTTRQTTFFPI